MSIRGRIKELITGRHDAEDAARHRTILQGFMGQGTWCVDHFEWDDHVLEIRGWAWFADSRPPTFSVNGEPFEDVEVGIARDDVGEILWFLPGAALAGFRCRTTVADERLFSRGHAVFQCLRADSGEPFREGTAYYCPDPSRERLPLPSPAQRIRVHGGDSTSSFLMEGYTAFMKLGAALRDLTGRHWGDFQEILDWGCGCGRSSGTWRRLRPAG
jgi:hypothetical protein